jgi:hypothetical protein
MSSLKTAPTSSGSGASNPTPVSETSCTCTIIAACAPAIPRSMAGPRAGARFVFRLSFPAGAIENALFV